MNWTTEKIVTEILAIRQLIVSGNPPVMTLENIKTPQIKDTYIRKRTRLLIMFGDAGVTDREDRIRIAGWMIGREIGSSNDMTLHEICTLINIMSAKDKDGLSILGIDFDFAFFLMGAKKITEEQVSAGEARAEVRLPTGVSHLRGRDNWSHGAARGDCHEGECDEVPEGDEMENIRRPKLQLSSPG